MTTVAVPADVRDEALHIVRQRLGDTASLMSRLEAFGTADVAHLLVDLERRFDIGIDPDEVLPNGTVDVLVNLVEIRAQANGRVFRWDDERARRGLPLYAPRPKLTKVADGIVQAEPPEPEPAPAEPTPAPIAPEPAYAARRPMIFLGDLGCAVPSTIAWEAELRRARRARRGVIAALAILVAAATVLAWIAL
jgi:hypothetical protein